MANPNKAKRKVKRPGLSDPKPDQPKLLGTTSLDDPRLRFNWGYHDARLDKSTNRGRRRQGAGDRPLPEWSAKYRAGYDAGWRSSIGDQLSTQAWKDTFPKLARFA